MKGRVGPLSFQTRLLAVISGCHVEGAEWQVAGRDGQSVTSGTITTLAQQWRIQAVRWVRSALDSEEPRRAYHLL